MIESFWGFMQVLLKAGFIVLCLAGAAAMWYYGGTPKDLTMWVASGLIHGMLLVFAIMVWRFEG